MLFATSCQIYADEGEWLQKFYDSRGVCVSSATVKNIRSDDSSLYVELAVDPEYLSRIKRGGDIIVRDWLALHCPLPLIAYRQHIGDLDVVVQGADALSLSCKQFELSRN